MTRIQCCVPFCKRTVERKQPHDTEQEAICGLHMRPVSRWLKRLHRETVIRTLTILNRYPEPNNAPIEEATEAVRLITLEEKLWRRMKRKAIEAAGGIG